MSIDPDLYARNGGLRVTRQDAREIGKRLHERAMARNRMEDGDAVWPAWIAALQACGLDVRIVRRDVPAEPAVSS